MRILRCSGIRGFDFSKAILDHQILEDGGVVLATLSDQHPMWTASIQNTCRLAGLVQHPKQRDLPAQRGDLRSFEVRLRRELDHVTIAGRVDRRVDPRVVAPLGQPSLT